MRNRSFRGHPALVRTATALTAGLALALPATAALAAAPTAAAPTAAAPTADRPSAPVATRRASTVTLPTGDHVRLSGPAGRELALIQPAAASGPGRALLTHRLGSHLYVLPADAEPYLGRFLDPALFDVTALSATRAADGRLPVRIGYRGSAPAVPGVIITSARAGTARGYLTPASSAAFGRALTAQWRADNRAHWPDRATLFTGVTRISADVAPPVTVRPHYPMFTLVVKTIGMDGKPQPFGFLGLMNVDDGRKYVGFVIAEDGEARVSVPKGRYSAIGDDFTFDEATGRSTVAITTANEQVTGAGQTLTIDHRTATARPSVQVPRPAALSSYTFDWTRIDAAEQSGLGWGYLLDASTAVRLAPSAPATVGTLNTSQNWNLSGPGSVPAYTFTLATTADRIPAVPHYRFTAAQLSTVQAAYYGEGRPATAGFLRYPVYADGGGGGVYEHVARGTRRTEYVGATGQPVWVDAALVNYDSWEDPGFLDGPARSLRAGTKLTIDWFRGPLAAVIPAQTGPGYCFGCRSGNTVGVGLAPFGDSDPTHLGSLFGAEDGLPVARFRFYRNATLVSDQDDYLGGLFTVPAAKAEYRAVLDVDRRLQDPTLSTRSNTELTFSSAAGQGPKLPAGWYCDDGDDCRVLPLLQARVALPTDLNGRLPAGRSTVTVTAARVQNATAAAVTSAGLEIRAAGWGWEPVPLTALGGGKYRGTIDNSTISGPVDVRLTAADAGGSGYRQTVLRAYTVAGS